MGRRAVLALFVASGLAALVYQIIWLRSLSTLFGSTVYATTTVLASFMAGLALGSRIFGRRADRVARPLALYAVLEIGIGVFGLLFPLILKSLDGLYVVLHRQVELSFYAVSLVRFVVCSMILIVPTTLMGGTFPIMNRYYVRRYGDLTANVSLLYGLNTLGAVCGVLLTAFVLMEWLGILRTSLVAVAVNMAVGAVAWWLSTRRPAGAEIDTGDSTRDDGDSTHETGATDLELPGMHAPGRRLILAAAFFSGFTALSYELLWTRTLVFVLDSFVQSYSIMLATLLAGIAVGSLAVSAWSSRIRNGYFLLAVLFVLIGVTTVATMPFLARLTEWKQAYVHSLAADATLDSPAPWGNYIAFKFLVSALIMLVPALLMGAAFPLAVRMYVPSYETIGEKTGTVYAVNTLGAIIGSFLTGFALIPVLGLRVSMIAMASLSAFTGLALFAFDGSRSRRARLATACIALAVFALVVVRIPRDLYERVFEKAQRTFDLVHYREDATATITVHRRHDRVLINLNAQNVAGTHFNFLTTQKMQAHLGLLLHPDPRRVLQIGFGSGGTAFSASQHPNVEKIDCVELCQGVIDVAGFFIPSNQRVLENPRIALRIEDARNYILATPARYDLILSDSIHPAYAGNGTLYSQDYFKLCRARLNPGGMVSFWMPTYLLAPRDYRTTIKTFQSVFPYVSIWYVTSAIDAYTIVIGGMEPLRIDVSRIERRLSNPDVAHDLGIVEVHSAMDVLGYFVFGPDRARDFASGGDINSDDRPLIELRAPRSMSRERTWYQNLKDLSEMREPVDPYLVNTPTDTDFSSELSRLYDATTLVIEGHLIDIVAFDFERQLRFYEEADSIYPGSVIIRRMEGLARSKVLAARADELAKSGRREQAISLYEQAIAANPDDGDEVVGHSHFAIGYLSLREGDLDRSMRETDRCLSILPTHAGALAVGATLNMREKRYAEAGWKIDKLLRLHPDDESGRQLRRDLDAAKRDRRP